MITLPADAISLVDIIDLWAKRKPDAEVFRFYPQGEGEFTLHSYAQFATRCRTIASQIQQYQGQRALLLFNSGMEFLEAFFACFYAGVTAVPAYPPRRNHNLDRLQALVADCDPAIILSADTVMEMAKPICEDAFDAKANAVPWLITNTLDNSLAQHYQAYHPQGDDLAFLQYTSGSTGSPKGVMVTHKNLLTNIRMAEQAFDLPQETRCVSWLPLFHDMGLIGAVMMPLYRGTGSALMPPAAFLQKPLRWLKLIDEIGKTAPIGSPNPNFCYQLCVDNVSDDDAKTLNLSNWIFAMNAAEPIRAKTIESFLEKFCPVGFPADAIRPSFGMAECSLLSTCRKPHEPIVIKRVSKHALAQNRFVETDTEAGSLRFVSSGTNCEPQTLRIVDPDTFAVLPDNQIGELWLKGDHIAQGYWGLDELTKTGFHAYTSDGQGPFMRTGDYATVSNGELFVTGRLKDLLIIRGRNHYPQDIEFTASSLHESLHLDNAAAFTIDVDDEERLVLLQELQRTAKKGFDAEKTAQMIRNAIAREHGIETHAIAFIRFSSLPKTTSGKIQRHICKQQFLDNSLNLIHLWQADNQKHTPLPKAPAKSLNETTAAELEIWITDWLAAKAHIDRSEIPVDAPLDGLGLDSVDLVQLSGEIEAWLQHPIDNLLIWQQPHIRGLAQTIHTLAQESAKKPASNDDSADIEGFI